MTDLARVLFCPVRHHSPRSSAVVRALLERARPTTVLIEGPSDASGLIPLLLDPETEPPVALLGYRTDGEVASAFWPFAAYSPEYVALRWALENGAEARFIDVPAGVSLGDEARAMREGRGGEGPEAPAGERGREGGGGAGAPEGEGRGGAGAPEGEGRGGPGAFEACAEGAGVRSFEELWEAHLEAPAYEPDQFREVVVEFAHLVRALHPRAIDRARDAYMLRQIGEALRGAGGEVAVVAGAAHVAAMAAGEVDPALEAGLPRPVASALTVIPFSFTRLSEQAGYGAGNRAPRFFQRAFERGCDFERASLEALLELASELRLGGHSASLADALEAFRLARTLSSLRGKTSAGLDELFEASAATFGRGDRAAIEAALTRIVVGSQVGRVTRKAGQGSLQREFWRELRRFGLPEGDVPRQVLLHLTQGHEVEASVFLQRLRVAGVPYAHFVGLTRVARGYAPGASQGPAAGGVEALRRATEAWEAQWTPATEAVLVERVVLGDSLEAVCTRLLCDRAAAALTTGEAAECVLDAALAGCVEAAGRTLDRCERLASGDEDVASLAHGCAVLSCLLRYGGFRLEALVARSAIAPLCVHWFRRAVLRLPAAASCDNDAAAKLRAAMRALHDVALTQPSVDPDLWWDALASLAGDFACHPSLAGFALGLLHLVDRVTDDEVARAFALRLSPGGPGGPGRAAAHVAGFLEVNPQAVVRSRAVVAALDGFLGSLEADAFRDLLPALRKAFGRLGHAERRLLLEGVFAVRNLVPGPAARAAVSAGEREALAALGGQLDQALDDLDDLL
ncbi:MAG TPA: DUF5682 family protein [Polyangiaceae bacterium]|nr:DUF5682 family protein [Polyangiaceae bacterium]